MKTKDDVIIETLNYHMLHAIQLDKEKKKGYGDRITKAARIVLAGGVQPVGNNHYEVASGTEAGKTYHVNGDCDCQDAENGRKHARGESVKTYAPDGYCKHKLAVILWGKVQAKLKWTVEKGFVHTSHRWSCDVHRGEPIECWQAVCPDPSEIPCPTCEKAAAETPNVPPHVEEIIAEEACTGPRSSGAPIEHYTIDPETGVIEETPMMSSIGETLKALVHGHTNGHTPEPPVVYTTPQYEPAPVILPDPKPLPEAGASLNIKVRVENFELMYTMRGHQDSEVLERLPNVLATLERLMKTEVDHDESFLKRLMHAFFPKPSRYTGK